MNVKGFLWLEQYSHSEHSKMPTSAQNSYPGCVGVIEFNYFQCVSFNYNIDLKLITYY